MSPHVSMMATRLSQARHLGGTVSRTASMQGEARRRLAIANSAFDRCIQKGYVRMVRRLILHIADKQALFKMTAAEILYTAGQQELELGFLHGLMAHRGEGIWALIQTEGRWATQLWDDVGWLTT